MPTFLLWLLLLIFCWPLALLALILYPLVWLILLPFRLLGIAVDGVFDSCARCCACPRASSRAIVRDRCFVRSSVIAAQ